MPANDQKPQASGPTPPRRVSMIPGGWIWAVVILGVLIIFLVGDQLTGPSSLSYSVFKEQIGKKNLKNVRISPSRINGDLLSLDPLPEETKKKVKSTSFVVKKPQVGVEDHDLVKQLDQNGITYDYEQDPFPLLGPFLIYVLFPLLLVVAIFFLFLPKLRDPMGGGFVSSYIKSPARKYEGSKQRVTFGDVAGMENAKAELTEVADFLRTPEKYQKLGGQIPKGVLLFGPPGVGKTLLARATAGEAGVPFFNVSASEFIQLYVGVGASRVRDLFKTAREHAPCIVFIDELDTIGRMRGAAPAGGHDSEREQTLNQILSEMDGFLPTESIIVLGATNRPDVLDSALLRPGRFDRHINIDRPTWQGRMAILKVHTRDKPLADDVNLEDIARTMIGMTGADLRNLANEAALIATRENKTKIGRKDFEAAADRVMIGTKREELLTPDDKKRTAYHEAGHALVCWHLPDADKPMKVSIIPRGQALGVNLNVPDEDRHHHSKEFFLARMAFMMGGRGADRLVYGQTYSGAESDIKQATRLARLMVTSWGMSDKVGPVACSTSEEHAYLGKEINLGRDFSEATQQLIDDEVRRLVREADEAAFRVLSERRKDLDLIVEQLLLREELSKAELEELLATGKLPPLIVPPPPPKPELKAEARLEPIPTPQPALQPLPAMP